MTLIGHNAPPSRLPELEKLARDFTDAAGAWMDQGAIDDEASAARANDYVAGARRLWQQIDDERKAEKQPHLDAGRRIDGEYKPLLDMLERSAKEVAARLTDYLKRQEEARRKEREAQEAAARAAARAAAEARRAAERRNDIAGQIEAEQAAEEARRALDAAAKPVRVSVESDSGGANRRSLRRVRKAKIANISAAFVHYRDRPEVRELIERLANAEIRAARGRAVTIPGIEIIEEEKI
ncbi:MAG: hypothetical protein D6773_03535 [Alphaproteobacteria bacterium]|nr:MAG: hypothetical protein D6773_03535 [Alphaproteobacteria bacterium]